MTRTEIWLTEMMCHFKSIDDMYRYYEHLVSLPNCNTCKRKDCKHKPKYGEDVRFNCFAYTDEEPKTEPFDKDTNVRSKDEAKLSEIPTSKCHYEPKTDCPWK